MSYERFVTALAAPIVRDFAAGTPPDQAAHLLDVLFAIKTADEAKGVLAQFAQHGQRAEWKQYAMYAGGSWKPDPHDQSVVRKADWAVAHKAELGDRGLVAFDAMRSAAIAAWACAAGLLPRDAALRAIGPALIAEVAKRHDGWADVAAQVRLAYGFVDGEVGPEVEAAIAAAWGAGLAWPSVADVTLAEEEEEEEEDEDGEEEEAPLADAWIAFELTVDCPGCGGPVFGERLGAELQCPRCAAAIAMAPEDWAYFFADDVKPQRRGDAPEIGNDFGDRFFSRRLARKVATLDCGAAFPEAPGEHACGCGAVHVARAADATAQAIGTDARLIVETRPAPAKPWPCVACGATVPAPGPIARCACGARTYIGPGYPRRTATYVRFSDSSRT